MKKQLLSTFTLLAFLVSSVASANPHESKHHGNPPDEKANTYMSLGILTVVSTLIYQVGKRAEVNTAALGLLHASNVLYNVGQVTDRPYLKDWGVRTLLGGLSSRIASDKRVAGAIAKDRDGKPMSDPKAQLVANIPMVGEALQQAGEYGAGVLTIALYNALGYGYEALRDLTPAGKILGLKN